MTGTLTARRDSKTRLHRLVGSEDPLIVTANRYLGTLAARGFSPMTIRSYAFAIVRFYRWFRKQSKLFKTLQYVDLLPFVTELQSKGARPRTINHRLTVIRSLFHFVTGQPMKWGQGACPPSRGLRHDHYDRRLGLHSVKTKQSNILRVKTPQTLIESLTANQVEAFLKTFHRYRDLALVYMMLLCGLRSREILIMRLDDLDAVEQCLRVRGKGRKERIVPMPDLLRKTLTRYLRLERPRVRYMNRLFLVLQGQRRGQPMTTAGLRSLFRCRRLDPNLRNAHPHLLRHTFGTEMARAGVSLAVLQRLMGHAYPDTTMSYVRLSMRDVHEAYHRALEVLYQKRQP